jgi:hypothetical protein
LGNQYYGLGKKAIEETMIRWEGAWRGKEGEGGVKRGEGKNPLSDFDGVRSHNQAATYTRSAISHPPSPQTDICFAERREDFFHTVTDLTISHCD